MKVVFVNEVMDERSGEWRPTSSLVGGTVQRGVARFACFVEGAHIVVSSSLIPEMKH